MPLERSAVNDTHGDISVPASFRAAFSSPRRLRIEVLAGLVVALALIPEAISFSILAGVDPRVGLFSSFIMAVTIAFTGGRPAMITAATGAVALVIAPLVASHGLNYLIAAVILAGVFQILLAATGVAKLMRFIPRSVMVGFVNALAILIFMAQIPHLYNVPWVVYPLMAVAIAIMVFLPRVTTAVPAPLIAIIVLTAVAMLGGFSLPDVADQGELPSSLPQFLIPDVPLTLETLTVIAPFSLAMALVGLMESLMTAKLVDDLTETRSDKTREAWGQGAANIASGFVGGMGGCAMIGQTMINVKESRARTRLSTFLAGIFLLILVVTLGDIVGQIPMAALVAIMIMVSVGTFDWHSIAPRTLTLMPWSETAVMLVTVAATLATHNLAVGVVTGVVMAMVMFARRVAHLTTVEKIADVDTDDDGRVNLRTYRVVGQLFFASSNDLVYQFDYDNDPAQVVIDLTDAEVWDASTVATLDAITRKYAAKGTEVQIIGLDGASKRRLDRLTGELV
ncbi:SulP family inorganic anion transporter [Corynebacterium sp. CCM 8835]|uniref:SulP family inorganic anion transporter n=1 Tax=Corynebacterium antarcticum TaxID=2800405 RepID=A0ABS1FLZ3_9CORY|nr:SulP family inorganic anion transporter [Corynebacterium antarcticum]MCK7643062.1 SulP family inorganic anion transporter [Corynebacterium antarcticum]MCL0246308.1 SulP family inorganic anion transporter [Corynebacterium antarcticum]MCX7493049.1 SulP family inorganic anion transporter [Corynebacterium antarcticum]MCX7540902.1 SulP family inorganic anion transporter [Corynebacterium antarcticum]